MNNQALAGQVKGRRVGRPTIPLGLLLIACLLLAGGLFAAVPPAGLARPAWVIAPHAGAIPQARATDQGGARLMRPADSPDAVLYDQSDNPSENGDHLAEL